MALLRVLLVLGAEREADVLGLIEESALETCCTTAVVAAEFRAALHAGVDVVLADTAAAPLSASGAVDILAAERLDVPLIALSSGLDDEGVADLLRRGASDYLRNPSAVQLHDAIQRLHLAQRRRAQRREEEISLAAMLRQRQAVVETIPDIIYTIDVEGRAVDWNQRLADVTGLSIQALYLRPALEFFDSEDQPAVAAAITEALATGYAAVEARMLLRDGSSCPYHFTGVPLRDESGALIGITGVGRDITERKAAEERTAALLGVAHDAAGSFDLAQILQRILRRTVEVLPCDIGAVFYRNPDRRSFQQIAYYGAPAEIETQLAALSFALNPFHERLAVGETVILEDIHESAAGGDAAADGPLLAVPLSVRGRQLGALVVARRPGERSFVAADAELSEGIARQIAVAIESTDLYRVQREEATVSGALARLGQELIAAFDTPDVLDRLCAVTTSVLECSTSHTLLLLPEEEAFTPVAAHGYPEQVWEGVRNLKMPRAWLEPESLLRDARPLRTTQIADPNLRQLTSSLGVAHSISMPLLRGNDVVGFHIACRNDDEGSFSPLQLRIARGIANLASLALEHARTVSELQEASRVKSEFVATISHELRTPLNVMLGYHEMLLESAAGALNSAQADLVMRSNRSARQLLELITDTLNLSRLESGRSQIEPRMIRLAELARELESETRGWHEKETVRAIWNVPDTLPPIYTDPQKLKVILKNLVSNALKFTDEGEVVVSARQNGDTIEIGVSDTGIGIPQTALDYIFDPFRQADGSSTRRHGGVGLGLYIVRRLIELLSGSVHVESELGNGSTFRVRLPVARDLAA